MATKHMTSCGIFGLDGSTWGASAGFPINTESIRQIVASISDASKMSNGLNVGADRYILVRNDPNVSIMLKKGPNGIVAYKSSQSVIVAMHDASVKPEIALTDIGRVIDYLSRHGY